MKTKSSKGSGVVKKIFLIMFLCLLCIRSALAANVSIDGVAFDGAKLIDSVTYVPIRSFSERMSECSVLWDPDPLSGISG